MGLGKLLVRADQAEARSVTYTATDSVTGQSQSWIVYDGIAPSWSSTTSYGVAPKVPGAWRASLLLSDLLGQVPWHSYRKLGRDQPEVMIWPTPPLLEQPAPPDVRMVTFSSLGLDLIYHGNAVALVAARSPLGWPTAIIPVSATAVGVRRVQQNDLGAPNIRPGALEYTIGDLRGLTSQDVIHIKGPCPPGALRGMGVLEAHLETLQMADEQRQQVRRIARHGVPAGVLKSNDPDLDDDDAADLKAKWMANQADSTIAVLNASTEFSALAWNPEQLQLVEARKFTLTELELIFGLPVGWLGGQTSSRVYSNIEQDNINLIRWSLGGHLARFEQTISAAQPRGTVSRASLDAFLRPDTLSRYQAYRLALDPAAPFLTVDEVRELEHRQPMPKPEPPGDAMPPDPFLDMPADQQELEAV